jgi:hypothetical protein
MSTGRVGGVIGVTGNDKLIGADTAICSGDLPLLAIVNIAQGWAVAMDMSTGVNGCMGKAKGVSKGLNGTGTGVE